MRYAVLQQDLIEGTSTESATGPLIPESLDAIPLERLRYDGAILDITSRVRLWHIDTEGRPRVDATPNRQPLTCAGGAALVRDAGTGLWRERTPIDDLTEARSAAVIAVDRAAEAARLRYVTAGVYQSAEYERAAAQADLFVAGSIRESAALQADINAGTVDPRTGAPVATLAEAADVILWRRAQWDAALDSIRAVRLKAKADIRVAADSGAVQAVLDGLIWPIPAV